MTRPPFFKWKKQTLADDCPTVECPPYDEYQDFKLDESSHYVLIRVDHNSSKIELAVCDPDHTIICIFRGRSYQEISHALFKYEKDRGLEWFRDKTHIAYLGKELRKAQTALEAGPNAEYYQE